MTEIAEPRIDVPEQRALPAAADSPPPPPWPALLIVLVGPGVLALVVWDGPSALRAVSVLAYLAVVPGLACARLIRMSDGLSRFVIGVALSLALGVLVAQGMIQLHRWSPLLGLSTLTTIASLAAVTELARDVREHRRGRGVAAE
ncbi:hypothetical protein DLJ46_13415 [Micromonospora globispora]|uniref:Uncharacterized protein n=1 Tax=Micromonospora globispora TaxID=1450148 RepID=A0A317K4H9_9ACTN|nr:hypothetical protein [Micromonospora globispora]PWU47801.1 hypothetical protein DLJ46_13415 [Micromonospora globispora]RQW86872.1 hypothetical protein DKL51_26675 [Micromonospora globispora]